MELNEFLSKKCPTLYRHQCGREYLRASENASPRHRLIICEQCLEPMPLCDQDRSSYSYEAVVARGDNASAADSVEPKTERPVMDMAPRPRPLSQETFQWSTTRARQPRRIAFASSTWI